MKKITIKTQKSLRYLIFLGIKLGIVGVLLVFAVRFYLSIERPTDLGSKIEYVGKINNNCFPMCGDPWGAEYYFATDITLDEVKRYFNKAKYYPSDSADDNRYGYWVVEYNYPVNEGMQLYFYDDINLAPERIRIGLKKTGKKHAIEIYSSDYANFKSALE